jgi:hypothetical protein
MNPPTRYLPMENVKGYRHKQAKYRIVKKRIEERELIKIN